MGVFTARDHPVQSDRRPGGGPVRGPCLTVSIVLATSVVLAGDPFDGTLDGWMAADGRAGTAGWEVVDDAVHLKAAAVQKRDGERAGNLLTAEPVGDFRLDFEWKIAPGGNSGIKYLVSRHQGRWLGCEYQIQDDTRRTSRPRNGCCALYDLYEPAVGLRLAPPGEWNTGRIVVDRGRIEHWANGTRVVEAHIGDDEWRRRIAASKFADVEGFAVGPVGRIMLTSHGSEVWYRHFRFQRLGDPVTASDVDEGGRTSP